MRKKLAGYRWFASSIFMNATNCVRSYGKTGSNGVIVGSNSLKGVGQLNRKKWGDFYMRENHLLIEKKYMIARNGTFLSLRCNWVWNNCLKLINEVIKIFMKWSIWSNSVFLQRLMALRIRKRDIWEQVSNNF